MDKVIAAVSYDYCDTFSDAISKIFYFFKQLLEKRTDNSHEGECLNS
jgi:hypothetical protein